MKLWLVRRAKKCSKFLEHRLSVDDLWRAFGRRKERRVIYVILGYQRWGRRVDLPVFFDIQRLRNAQRFGFIRSSL